MNITTYFQQIKDKFQKKAMMAFFFINTGNDFYFKFFINNYFILDYL